MRGAKAILRVSLFIFGLFVALNLGNGIGPSHRYDNPTAVPPTKYVSAAEDETSQPIDAAHGNRLELASSGSVFIPPGALTSGQTATLSPGQILPAMPPNGLIFQTGPILHLHLSRLSLPLTSLPTSKFDWSPRTVDASEETTYLQFNIVLLGSPIGIDGALPMAVLQDSHGPSFVGLKECHDSYSYRCALLPSSLLNGVTDVFVSLVNWSVAMDIPYRPMSFTAEKGWQALPDVQQSHCAGKTLVLIHGMFSSVEHAFTYPDNIKQAGGYTQVFGFNYDWAKGISDSGLKLAAFLNALAQSCHDKASIDIVAHSEGVAVTLSALTSLDANASNQVGKVIALGGPIMGTPIARAAPAADAAASILTVLMNMPYIGPAVSDQQLFEALESPVFQDLSPESPTMEQIRESVAQNASSKRFLLIAGAKCNFGLACNYLSGFFPSGTLFDGLIAEDSAFSTPQPNANPRTTSIGTTNVITHCYKLGHTELTDNKDVIKAVGNFQAGISGVCDDAPSAPTNSPSPLNITGGQVVVQ